MRFSGMGALVLVAVPVAVLLTIPAHALLWDYTVAVPDPVNDQGTYPSYYDVVQLGYGYNSTHVGFNITVNDAVPPNSTTGLIFHVWLDVDNDPSTGYDYLGNGSVGADYMVEQVISSAAYGAYLYRYNGTGSDWSWVEVAPVYYSINNDTAIYIVNKTYLDGLGGSITIAGSTEDGNGSTADYVIPSDNPLPIPEPWSVAPIALTAAVAIYWLRTRH